jgi:hypothetical protein
MAIAQPKPETMLIGYVNDTVLCLSFIF